MTARSVRRAPRFPVGAKLDFRPMKAGFEPNTRALELRHASVLPIRAALEPAKE